MSNSEAVRRYPRLSAALLAVAEEADAKWAGSVIESAKNPSASAFAQGLVREAFRKRHLVRRTEANREVTILVDGKSKSTSQFPNEEVA